MTRLGIRKEILEQLAALVKLQLVARNPLIPTHRRYHAIVMAEQAEENIADLRADLEKLA